MATLEGKRRAPAAPVGDRLHRLHGRRQDDSSRARCRPGGDRGRRAAPEGELGMLIAGSSGVAASRVPRPGVRPVGQRCSRTPTGRDLARRRAVLERVRAASGRHVVVWLQVSAEEAWRRVEGSNRPLGWDHSRGAARRARAHLRRACRRDPPARTSGMVRRALPAAWPARASCGRGMAGRLASRGVPRLRRRRPAGGGLVAARGRRLRHRYDGLRPLRESVEPLRGG